jgi:pilus assembly protein Flp/PilA
MNSFKQILSGLVKEESGQDLVEYALVVAMVAGICLAASTQLSTVISDAITSIGTKIQTSITGTT